MTLIIQGQEYHFLPNFDFTFIFQKITQKLSILAHLTQRFEF